MNINRCYRRRTVGVVLAGAGLATMAACGSDGATVQAANGALSEEVGATTPIPTEDPSEPSPLSDETLGAARHTGTDFEPVDAAEAKPAISMDRAIQLAAKEFGYEDRRPTQVGLGRVTIRSMGKHVATDDPAKPTRIEPSYADRLSWIVVYDHIKSSAPKGDPTDSKAGTVEFETHMMMLFDANTGEFIFGRTFSPAEAKEPPYGTELPTDVASHPAPRRQADHLGSPG